MFSVSAYMVAEPPLFCYARFVYQIFSYPSLHRKLGTYSKLQISRFEGTSWVVMSECISQELCLFIYK